MQNTLAVSLDDDYEVQNDASPNATALELAIPAGGGKFLIQFDGHVSAPERALKFNFGGDAPVLLDGNNAPVYIGQWTGHEINNPALGFTCRRTNPTSFATPTLIPGGIGPLDGVESIIKCRGHIQFTDGGTFILRAAQTVPNSETTKLLAGSGLILIPC